MLVPAAIPSPGWSQFNLGPLTVHAYALCIIAGIFVAVVSERRSLDRGGEPGDVEAIAMWAVPFGIVGGRLYHVATDSELYLLPGHDPWDAFAIWRGGCTGHRAAGELVQSGVVRAGDDAAVGCAHHASVTGWDAGVLPADLLV